MNKEDLLEAHAMALGLLVANSAEHLNEKYSEYYSQIKNLIKKYGDEK